MPTGAAACSISQSIHRPGVDVLRRVVAGSDAVPMIRRLVYVRRRALGLRLRCARLGPRNIYMRVVASVVAAMRV